MSVPSRECLAVLRQHSSSFTLASRLLPRGTRDEAAIVYAWCRRADDAIDQAHSERPAQALLRLRCELEELEEGEAPADPVLAAFRELVRAREIPLSHARELLRGMEMDVLGVEYQSLEQLLGYCYCVASTVGLMMCHVLGVSQPAALRHAAHLGLAMQLTNICRDVAEDWQRGRLYLPADVLRRHGIGSLRAGAGPFPASAVAGCRGVLAELLALADRYYASGDAGLAHLSPRCALAVEVARRVYSAIGARLALRNHDVLAERAVVPAHEKLFACAVGIAHYAARQVKGPRLTSSSLPPGTPCHGPELLHL